VGLDAGFVLLGELLLFAVGRVRSLRAAVVRVGLALMLGWTVTAVVVSLALTAGASASVAEILVGWALGAGVLLLVGLRVPSAERAPLGERRLTGRGVALAAAAFVGAFLAELFRATRDSQTLHPDAWNFWLPKAETIAYFGGLDTQPGGFTSFTNADYPPLTPAMDAISFRFLGRVDPIALPAQHWVVAVAFFLAVAALLAPRVRPAFLWPGVAFAVMLPGFTGLIGSSLGDEPLAMLFTLCGVCFGLWLLGRDKRDLVLGAVFLAALSLTKNEGLMLSACLLLALFAVGLRRCTWRLLLPLVLVVALPTVSWRLWLAANDVAANDAYRFSDLIHLGYLSDRLGRLGIALHGLVHYVFSTPRWLIAVPLALALGGLLTPRRPGLVGFVLGTCFLAFLGYAAIYWISPYDIHYYVDTSAARVVSSIVLLGAVALPLFLQEVLDDPERDGAVTAATTAPR
jgi:hypothetical protein